MRAGRAALAAAAVLAVTGMWLAKGSAISAGAKQASGGLYGFAVRTIDGDTLALSEYRGKALLIVNTASRCGFTPQYRSLESLYRKYRARGFEVLAFPANDFMNQEPGTNKEIREFCTKKYATTFTLFAKVSVRGKDIAPLYRYLTQESAFKGDIEWNFTKFLVAPDGKVVARFRPNVDPLSESVVAKLEKVLPAR